MEVKDERKQAAAKSGGKSIFQKLKEIKNVRIIAAVFIIAVALLIYSTVTTAKQKKADVTSSAGVVMTSDEQRLSAILSNVAGAGKVEAMITSVDGKISGVIVVADGADSITVRLKLLDATATALGVDKRIINVYGRDK